MKLASWHVAVVAVSCFGFGLWVGYGLRERPGRQSVPLHQPVALPIVHPQCAPCAAAPECPPCKCICTFSDAVANQQAGAPPSPASPSAPALPAPAAPAAPAPAPPSVALVPAGRSTALRYSQSDCAANKVQLGDPNYGYWTTCTAGLSADSVVFSFGIGEDMSWDEDIMRRFKSRVYGFDPTPKSRRYVERQDRGPLWTYREIGLADRDTTLTLHLPSDDQYVSASVTKHRGTGDKSVQVKALSLRSAMAEVGVQAVDLIKMDVEGAEFAIIDAWARDNFWPSNQLLIEFHSRFEQDGLAKLTRAQQLIEKAGYTQLFGTDNEEFSYVRYS